VFGITSSLTNTDVATLDTDGRLFRTPFSTIATSISLLTAPNALNTGGTYGIYDSSFSGASGSTTLVFKSLSGGNNIVITSSSTENSIALANNISVNSISANTFYSGATLLNLGDLINSYWSASTGPNSLIRNNGTGNLAVGNFSIIAGHSSTISTGSDYSGILHAKSSQITNSLHSSIIAGSGNQINYFSTATTYATILNGKGHYSRGNYSSILNGVSNSIGYHTTKSTILNGNNNIIQQYSSYNSILNGKNNYIFFNTSYSTIINGNSNVVSPYMNNITIIGTTGIVASESNAVYVPKLFITSTIEGGDRMVTLNVADGKVYIKPLPSFTGATSTGLTHSVYAGTFDNNLVFKSFSGGNNIIVTSSSTENAVALSNNIIINSISANTISGGTFYSGSTPFENIFITTGSTSGIGTSIFINKTGSQLNLKSISAGTNVTLFDDGSNITISSTGGVGGGATVNNGLNTYTAGTNTFQSVNMSAATLDNLTVSGNTLLSTLSATTISASTLISGSTNVDNLFSRKKQYKIKTVQQIHSATTTVTVDELTLDLVGGKKYLIDGVLTISGATGGGRFGLSGTSSPTLTASFVGTTNGVTAFQGHLTQTNGLISSQTVASSSAIHFQNIKGLIQPSSDGTISVVYRAVSGGNNICVEANSWLILEEI
jgi:hypothetical protein